MKTRMERYKELRESLSSEVDQNIANHDLSAYANRLNKIDDAQFEDMNQNSDPNYEPSRAKDVDLKKYETFENEYLKDFLDEVKSYNIEKGHRHVDDTEQNILEEIQAQNKDKITLGTKEAPLGLDDLELIGASETTISNETIDFDKALDEVTSDPQLLNEDDMSLEEDSIDTDTLIDTLQSNNFIQNDVTSSNEDDDIFSNIQTFDIELEDKKQAEELIKQDTEKIESITLQKELKDDSEENFDSFWEDYLQKMNELEDDNDHASEKPRDTSNLPKQDVKKVEDEKEEEPRDITQEFLALTQEIEKENLESIDLSHQEDDQTSSEEKLQSEDQTTSLEVGADSNTNRFVNAILTIALAGIILGVAIALKYFFLN